MTEKQKAARAKFKMAIAETKKLRAKNPKLTQAQALKQAFAILYSKDDKVKKVGAVKKKAAPKKKAAVKKVVAKKAASKKKALAKKITGSHKDTKSHNVNIRVVSGVEYTKKEYLEEIEVVKKVILEQIKELEKLQKAYKETKDIVKRQYLKNDIGVLKYNFIPHNKRYLISLRSTLKKSI